MTFKTDASYYNKRLFNLGVKNKSKLINNRAKHNHVRQYNDCIQWTPDNMLPGIIQINVDEDLPIEFKNLFRINKGDMGDNNINFNMCLVFFTINLFN